MKHIIGLIIIFLLFMGMYALIGFVFVDANLLEDPSWVIQLSAVSAILVYVIFTRRDYKDNGGEER